MILVTGGSGQLGSAFARLLPDAVFTSRQDLDLSNPKEVGRALGRLQPRVVINCAAYTAVDRAETEPDLARRVNAVAVGAMAEWAAAAGARFVTFSTDYVFDGEAVDPYVESAATGPRNVYGKTKLEGEHLALEAHPAALVIRTAWLLSPTHPNFVSRILERARAGPVQVVTDQVGSPSLAEDVATQVWRLVESQTTGIVHVVNAGAASWFDLALEAARAVGVDPATIEPTTTASYPTAARRPRYSVLGSERGKELGLSPLPSWRDRLPDLVAALEH